MLCVCVWVGGRWARGEGEGDEGRTRGGGRGRERGEWVGMLVYGSSEGAVNIPTYL